MRYLVLLLALSACTHPKGVEVRVQKAVEEVQRPCPVTVPKRPAPLKRPLPSDYQQLAAVLGEKLTEWSGPGKYGDRADAALRTCTNTDQGDKK